MRLTTTEGSESTEEGPGVEGPVLAGGTATIEVKAAGTGTTAPQTNLSQIPLKPAAPKEISSTAVPVLPAVRRLSTPGRRGHNLNIATLALSQSDTGSITVNMAEAKGIIRGRQTIKGKVNMKVKDIIKVKGIIRGKETIKVKNVINRDMLAIQHTGPVPPYIEGCQRSRTINGKESTLKMTILKVLTMVVEI